MKRSPDWLLWGAATLLLTVFAIAGVQSAGWVGKPFAGFLVLENRVVASAGLAHWPAVAGGEIFQNEIVSVAGEPLHDPRHLEHLARELPVGSPLVYRLSDGEREIERTVETRLFTGMDYALLFGTLIGCGFLLGVTALGVRYLRGNDTLANGTFPTLWIIGVWAITAADLYGPYRLFRLHALCETLLFAAVIHLALVFPHPYRVVRQRPRVVLLPYAAALLLAAANQIGLHDAGFYTATHQAAVGLFGLSLVLLIGSQVAHFVRARTFEVRQRVKVVALGTVLALGPQVVLALLSIVTGSHAPQNAMAFSGVLFPLSIAYAVLRHNLLGVDELVRRTLNYALLTVGVTGLYLGAVAGFDAVFQTSSSGGRTLFHLVFAPVCIMLLLPFRDRVQSGVDRVFFRTAYDFRRIVEEASTRLASVADLAVISSEIDRVVTEALHPEWMALYVRREPGAPLLPVAGTGSPPIDVETRVQEAAGSELPFEIEPGGLAVPFRAEGRLVALLLLGRRLSGRFYGGDDRRLLHTLANQGAVAIENALALDQLRDLNRDLEEKVRERTGELAATLDELRRTQAQLVHREKMASVGQFVAGIAHEMNNPLAFIGGNLHFLRSYTQDLVGTLTSYEDELLKTRPELHERVREIRAERDVDAILGDLESVFDGCADGVQRTTTLVKDLRTFSRLDDAERQPVDLWEALDSTLNVLRSRLVGIEVVKEYGNVPTVECLASQLNQVFMNLVANAADAVGEGGRITLRTLEVDEERVAVEVEDDGPGIDPEVAEKIFDPFFTTKEIGAGTGLGLAISYGIVTRHGGTITLVSPPGSGARFRIELPTCFQVQEEGAS